MHHLASPATTPRFCVSRRPRSRRPAQPSTPTSETTLRLITAVANAADGTDPELAGKLYAESLERNRRARGPEHPLTLIALNNLASWHLGQGRYSEGEKIHRELLDIRLRTLGENHPDTIVSLRNIGSSLAVQQRTAESIEFLSRVVEVGDRVRGASHPAQLSARVELAIGHAFQNDIDRALALLRESLPRTLSASGKPTPDTFSYLETLCNILMHAQRFDAALVEANAAIKAAGEIFGADSDDARRSYTLARARTKPWAISARSRRQCEAQGPARVRAALGRAARQTHRLHARLSDPPAQ